MLKILEPKFRIHRNLFAEAESSVPVMVIGVSTMASVIALIVLVLTVYMLTRNCRRERRAKKEEQEFKNKMKEVR